MSEQRVLYLHDVSVEGLAEQMNELIGNMVKDMIVDAIEHYAILGDDDIYWRAIVLVNGHIPLPICRMRVAESAEYMDVSEYPS